MPKFTLNVTDQIIESVCKQKNYQPLISDGGDFIPNSQTKEEFFQQIIKEYLLSLVIPGVTTQIVQDAQDALDSEITLT